MMLNLTVIICVGRPCPTLYYVVGPVGGPQGCMICIGGSGLSDSTRDLWIYWLTWRKLHEDLNHPIRVSSKKRRDLAGGYGLLLVEIVTTLGYLVHYFGVIVVVGNIETGFI